MTEKRYDLGPCPKRGEKEYCDGTYNGSHCLLRYAFFGLLETFGGKKAEDVRENPDDSCPVYVEFQIPWEGQLESIGVTDGGRLEGMSSGVGPCAYQVMNISNHSLQETVLDLFALVPEGEAGITKYLMNLGASDDIRERVIKYLE